VASFGFVNSPTSDLFLYQHRQLKLMLISLFHCAF